MLGFRLSDQKPPEAKRVTDVVVMRLDHVFEVDPRWEHLTWMHDHWADAKLSGEELLEELEAE